MMQMTPPTRDHHGVAGKARDQDYLMEENEGSVNKKTGKYQKLTQAKANTTYQVRCLLVFVVILFITLLVSLVVLTTQLRKLQLKQDDINKKLNLLDLQDHNMLNLMEEKLREANHSQTTGGKTANDNVETTTQSITVGSTTVATVRDPIVFRALKTTAENVTTEIIPFEDAGLNKLNSYNTYTGIFTAPADGIYIFAWTIVTMEKISVATELVVNNQVIAKGFVDARDARRAMDDSSTNVIPVSMKQGEKAFIRIDNRWGRFIDGGKWSSFSGWRLN